MRLLAMRVLRELRGGVDTRPMEMYDETEDEWQARAIAP
jgi:hypothetical protein